MAAKRYIVVVEAVAEQRVEADDWRVVGDFVVFGSNLSSNRPHIVLAVAKGKVLLIREESTRST